MITLKDEWYAAIKSEIIFYIVIYCTSVFPYIKSLQLYDNLGAQPTPALTNQKVTEARGWSPWNEAMSSHKGMTSFNCTLNLSTKAQQPLNSHSIVSFKHIIMPPIQFTLE